MTKVKKTILWSTIACLCVFAIAGTAIGVTYSLYRTSSSGSGIVNIPTWGFDLSSDYEADFDVETSAKLSPNDSTFTEGNTNRYSISDPIGIAKITNKGDVIGDLEINAGIKESDPYQKKNNYESNEQFENEFLDHFEVSAYYSPYLDSTYGDGFDSTLVSISSNSYLTLYPQDESDDISTFSSVYIYVKVKWISDIDNNNGDAFDTWVGRYISKINLTVGFYATQHGAFTPTSETTKFGAQINAYTCYYFDGTITDGHLGVTTNYDEAVDLIITEFEEGKYTLGFYGVEPTRYYSDSSLTYIGYNGSGTNLTLSSDPYTWYYDDSYDVFYTYDSSGSQRFIGNQDGQEYFACYSYTNINSDSYHTGSSYEREPELEEAPNEPQVGDQTYKLGVLDGDTYKYFDGTISSSHLVVTTSYDDAVDVYITGLNDGIDNTCTLAYYEGDTIKYIACSESNTNMKADNSPYTWTWAEPIDDAEGYFYTSSFSDRFIGEQSGSEYFACYASNNLNSYNHVVPFPANPDLLAPDSITISADQDKTEIEVDGHPLQLYATVSPSSGVNEHVIWSSSDDGVASVSQTGLVSPVSEGEVIIYACSAADSNVKGEYKLTVVSASELVYEESEEIVAADVYSSVADNATITDDIIYGDLVTIGFAANGGNTAPHYYNNGNDFRIYSKNQIIFTPVDESVAEISKIELTYTGSYYGNDSATFTDANGNEAGSITNPKSSSGGTITIDVTASGEVIYCNDYSSTSGGTQLRCTKITIYYEIPNAIVPTSITISGDQEVEEGSSIQLTASVSPEEANQKVTWSSLDETIASVSQSGLVTGVGAGEATIRATSILSDEVYGEYEVTVNAKVLGDTPEGLIGTYDFSKAGRTSNNSSVATTAVDTFFTTENVYIGENVATNPYNACTAAEKVGLGADGSSSGGLLVSNNCLKLGTSSATGSLTITFNDVSISEIVLYVTSWNDSNTPVTISVNDEVSATITQPGSSLSSVEDITPATFTLSNATDTITISTSKPSSGDYRAVIYMMKIYYYNS
ncbi:MAG: Ig-like domain-containing protein [Coprobacillus sp.]|nr:Ig-like domain-containing protein [Coprobacillus sp.]